MDELKELKKLRAKLLRAANTELRYRRNIIDPISIAKSDGMEIGYLYSQGLIGNLIAKLEKASKSSMAGE